MKPSIKSSRRQQNGFSVVEGLAALGILSLILGVAATVGVLLNEASRLDTHKASFQNISSSVMSTITHQGSWDLTKTKNPEMACAKTFPSSCANGTQSRVTLYNSEGKKLTDPTNPAQGFRTNGEVCFSFNTGEAGCLYQAQISWFIKCSSTESCQYPEEQVSLEFKYNGSEKLNIESFNVPPQARANLAANQSPTSSCAKNGKVFVGYGKTLQDGDGGNHSSDALGCLDLMAFRGPTGLQGPTGATGAMGARGPTGPQGPDGGLSFLPSSPPPLVLPPMAAAPSAPPPVVAPIVVWAPAPTAPPPPVFVATAPPPSCGLRAPYNPETGRCDSSLSSMGSPLMIVFNSDVKKPEPLVFSSQKNGINFDILGRNSTPTPHTPKRISWYRSPQYYFIALPNEHGQVRGVDQLFGDNTYGPDGKFATDGYKALAKYDSDMDSYITEADPVYAKLRLWQDENYDGYAQENEMLTLRQMGIEIIDLNADPNFKEVDKYGNETTLKSVVKTTDGHYHLMFDVWFAYHDIPKEML